MEYLRWILLLAGVLFIAVVYFLGRQHLRNTNYADSVELDHDRDQDRDQDRDLPSISTDEWDELDDGVGDVRVVTEFDDDDARQEVRAFRQAEPAVQKPKTTTTITEPPLKSSYESAPRPKPAAEATATAAAGTRPDDLVTLYLLAKNEPLSGDMINSAAYANGLSFGRMNIFHRLDDNDEPIYSMANMMEPGNFDPETIHTLKTRGLVLFIQFEQLKYPSEALHDMLRCAYRMADMIGARLCNHTRQALTEKDAIAYRQLAAMFDAES